MPVEIYFVKSRYQKNLLK